MKRPLQFLGEAWLLGSAALAFLLMAMSFAGIRWSRGSLIAAVAILIAFAAWRFSRTQFERPRLGWPNLLDLVTLALIAGYACMTALAPPAEADFYSIWGVKAKQFFLHGGIDWEFVAARLNVPLHPDYPILLPLLYDVQAILNGAWPDERWLSVIHIGVAVAALMVIRALLADDMPKLGRAAATLIVMPLVFSPYFGLPEGLLAAYGTIALLFLRRAVRDDDTRAALHGAIYLGLAASCKNEGLTLLVAAALALVVTRRRLVLRLWPAAAIVAPWLLAKTFRHFESYFAEGGALQRAINRITDPISFLRTLYDAPHGRMLFWIGIALAIVVAFRQVLERERFLALALIVQLLFFVGAYLITPYDLASHASVSWERILRQIMPAIALLALLSTVIRFAAENRNASHS